MTDDEFKIEVEKYKTKIFQNAVANAMLEGDHVMKIKKYAMQYNIEGGPNPNIPIIKKEKPKIKDDSLVPNHYDLYINVYENNRNMNYGVVLVDSKKDNILRFRAGSFSKSSDIKENELVHWGYYAVAAHALRSIQEHYDLYVWANTLQQGKVSIYLPVNLTLNAKLPPKFFEYYTNTYNTYSIKARDMHVLTVYKNHWDDYSELANQLMQAGSSSDFGNPALQVK